MVPRLPLWVELILGHASISTTEKYTHVASDFMSRARDRIDRALERRVDSQMDSAEKDKRLRSSRSRFMTG